MDGWSQVGESIAKKVSLSVWLISTGATRWSRTNNCKGRKESISKEGFLHFSFVYDIISKRRWDWLDARITHWIQCLKLKSSSFLYPYRNRVWHLSVGPFCETVFPKCWWFNLCRVYLLLGWQQFTKIPVLWFNDHLLLSKVNEKEKLCLKIKWETLKQFSTTFLSFFFFPS